jgi:hypothetical protein
MSSSTSSSEQTGRGRKLRIALVIAAVLVLIEWGTRATFMPGTDDLIRYRAFPERARGLAAARGTSIAFVGNSVTDRIRLDDMRREWQSIAGAPLQADKFVAYYSNLTTWYWMTNQYFLKPGLEPDLVVVTYYEGNALADSEIMDVGNLALFFTDGEDRASLFRYDLTTLEHRSTYLLSSVSEAFAARDRIRDRTLNFIPGYRPYATAVNEVNFEHEKRGKLGDPPRPRTFHTLERFLADAREAGVTVCFVAFPVRPGDPDGASYIIHPRGREMIANSGMIHLDLRDMPGLTADMYTDNVHLNARGAPIYTRQFVQALYGVWRPQ